MTTPDDEVRCRNCERPIIRVGYGRVGDQWKENVWYHRAIEPEKTDFYYCTIKPNVLMSKQPHAEPTQVVA